MSGMNAVTGLALAVVGVCLGGCCAFQKPDRTPLAAMSVRAATVVNVTDSQFGAKGDGQTDDTVAIAKAAKALKPGDVLYFPLGTYLTDTLVLPSNVTVRGDTAWFQDGQVPESILKPIGDPTKQNALIRLSKVTGLRLGGLTLEGTGTAGNQDGIVVETAPSVGDGLGLLIEGCKVRRFAGNGISLSDSRGISISRCTITDNGQSGLRQDAGKACSELAVSDSRFARNGKAGIFLFKGHGRFLRIVGSHFEQNQGPGILIHGSDQAALSRSYRCIEITACNFEVNGGALAGMPDTTDYHISLGNVCGATVTGNVFRADTRDGNPTPVLPGWCWYVSYTTDCVILGNAVHEGFGSGLEYAPSNTNIRYVSGPNPGCPRAGAQDK